MFKLLIITDSESGKILLEQTYSMEDPSTDDSQTVKSPPQTAFVTSETWLETGDNSNSTEIK